MTREIPLTRGYVALVDDEDYEWLIAFRWRASPRTSQTYAMRRKGATGSFMHREVLGAVAEGAFVDHIDHNGLNNQRANLRIATPTQNRANERKRIGTSSQFKGVTWHRGVAAWVAQTKVAGKRMHLGTFRSEVDAARAYDVAAVALWGEYAHLNFPVPA